jgi:hypothetical protein
LTKEDNRSSVAEIIDDLTPITDEQIDNVMNLID